MGLRYRQTYYENGDIVDPTGWVLDNNELAGEVNGSLDRDNIPASTIVQAEIVGISANGGPFTSIFYRWSDTAYAPTYTTTAWQGGTGNGVNGIFSYTVTADEDCVLVVEMDTEWATGAFHGGGPVDWPRISDTMQLRITVDGIVIAQSGYLPILHLKQIAYATYLIGSGVVVAGDHDIRVEVQVAQRASIDDTIQVPCQTEMTFLTRNLCVTQEKR